MKQRADIILMKNDLVPSREKAKALIMSGLVYCGEERVDKPGQLIEDTAVLTVRGGDCPYVSRGGTKLEKAISEFNIDLSRCVCADIGASTGGFTDCMLQNGAKKVYAIDVGYGQLAWKLRSDERVVNIERTNIRYITKEQLPQPLDFFTVDVSFISLGLVVPVVADFLGETAKGVCLIKPQFEAGREKVGKNGVVRDPDVHAEVINKVFKYIKSSGLRAAGLTWSPIKGPKGNIEYLVFIEKTCENSTGPINIKNVVAAAHKEM